MSNGRSSATRASMRLGAYALAIAMLVSSRYGVAATTVAPIPNIIAGGVFDYAVKRGDTLEGLSSRYGVAASAIAADNALRRNARLRRGQVIRIDNRHIVPKSLSRGILINIPQRMLFLFENGGLAAHYPVSLGRPSWRTPLGSFTVIEMRENPTWIVPESIQHEMEEQGEDVETCVPPGPDNPLGHYALDLSMTGYRIHGTIAPWSIYRFSTHGCIRLHPDDIADLYRRVTIGEPGEIVYQPVMLAALPDGRIFLEVNRDVYRKGQDPSQTVRALAETGNLGERIDWQAADRVVRQAEGIAREVDRGNPAAAISEPPIAHR